MNNTKNKLQAYGGKVIVKKTIAETKTAAGLLDIPDEAQQKSNSGTVVHVSHYFHNTITGIKENISTHEQWQEITEGDLVYFDKYAGNIIKFENEEFLVLKRDDILALVKAQ